MSLFCPHDSKGPPLVIWSGARAGMRGSMGALSRRFSASMLHVSTVEITEGASGFSVIRGVRFLHSASLRSK